MRFLVPVGGVVEGVYGILGSYKHRGVPAGIQAGLPWAGDNCAYTGFNHQRFINWLELMNGYRHTCLFVAAPDSVGNAEATLYAFEDWWHIISNYELPVAYVAQDGSEDLEIPEGAEAIFIGGTTKWKESAGAVDMIRRAQELGLHVHIGRVNWGKRYRMFRVLDGSDHFTCDGTRTRYDGVERTLEAWRSYENQDPRTGLGK